MDEPDGRKHRFTIYICSSLVSLGGLLFGFNTAVVSGVLLFLKADWGLSDTLQGVVVSAVLFGALLGAACTGVIADRFGRRGIIAATAAVFALGSFVAGLAPSVSWLVAGRVIAGIAVGAASLSVPLYISEISPPRIRGALVSVNQLAITLGILMSYLVNAYFADFHDGWRYMFAVGAVPALMLMLGVLLLPDSPRWMIVQGDEEEARDILTTIGVEDPDRAIRSFKLGIDDGRITKTSDLFKPWIRPALIAGVGLFVVQQFSGINAIIYYAPTIFRMAGFESHAGALFATVGIGAINVLFTLVAMRLIDVVGRKPLISIGLIGMTLSLAAMGIILSYPSDVLREYNWLLVEILVIYIASFSVGLGTAGWLVISEIYPLRVRGAAMSIPTVTHWACNIIVSMTFLVSITIIGVGGVFWLFAAIALAGWFFLRHAVPETKGLTLEAIERRWIGIEGR